MIGTDAERAVLGACIWQPSSIRFAAEVIDPTDFSHPSLGQAFNVVAGLRSAGLPVDYVSLNQEIARRKIPGIGPADPAQWVEMGGNEGSIKHHAGIVREASVRRQSQAVLTRGMQHVGDPSAEPGQVIAETVRGLREIQDSKADNTLQAHLLRDVLAVADSFDWAIPGLLERGDRVVVTAGEGAGKTTFIRQFAVAAAAGVHPVAFTPIDPLKVLVIDAENTESQWRHEVRGMVSRGRLSGSADPADNVSLACSRRLNIVKDADLGAIHRLIDESEAQLVCVGPLYRLVQGSVNGEDDVAPILAALDTIRDRGLAMVIEAHAGHSKDATGTRELRPRGSSALMGWPEFGFGLAVSRDDPEHLVELQRWRGDRAKRDWPAKFYRGGPWPWTDADMNDRIRQAAYGRQNTQEESA